MRNFFILTILSLGFLACQSEDTTKNESPEIQLGNIDLSFSSGLSEAKKKLEKGILLLHSFEYDDARTAFRQTQQMNPDIPMAVWGEAMTYNHPLWRQQEADSARQVLRKLGDTPEKRIAKGKNEIEKGFLKAAEILYGEGDKKVRDQKYAAFMAEFYAQHPDNHEIAAFYALSLLGSVEMGRDEALFHKGAKIAQSILAENNDHPGALHYLIHAYDDPKNAVKAIQAANRYSGVAPDAAHALHMPSHIYVALGMWDEVVKANIASYNASVNRMKRLELDHNARSFHALHWLMYGYLQQQRLAEAKQLLHDMTFFAEKTDSRRARAYLVSMQANYLVETDNWNTPLSKISTDLSDLNINKKALYRFIEGMNAYQKQDTGAMRQIIVTMETERQEVTTLMNEEGMPMCNANGPYSKYANKLDINQAHVMEMEIRGLYNDLLNKSDVAEKWLQEATQLESSISYAYGPPVIAYPSFELYADWLIQQEQWEQAKDQLEKALQRGPNRLKILKAMRQIAQLQNDQQAVASWQEKIDAIIKITAS